MRSRLRFALVVAFAAGSLACGGPQQAPKDLNGLARFFFNKFAPGDDVATSDQEIQDAFTKLHKVVKGEELSADKPDMGVLENLTQEEMDTAGMDRDPDEGQGMYITNIVHCDMDRMQEIIVDPDQLEMYPEAYAEYERDYDEDVPDYFPTWEVTYKSSENALITNQFTATIETGLRVVPKTDDADFGTVLVRAGWLPEPAEFENEGSEFTFDFQVETYHSRGDGEIVHFYAMWRYMKLGVLGDSYDQTFIDQTEQGMIDWDAKTDELCD
jgi:hypothetical protein